MMWKLHRGGCIKRQIYLVSYAGVTDEQKKRNSSTPNFNFVEIGIKNNEAQFVQFLNILLSKLLTFSSSGHGEPGTGGFWSRARICERAPVLSRQNNKMRISGMQT